MITTLSFMDLSHYNLILFRRKATWVKANIRFVIKAPIDDEVGFALSWTLWAIMLEYGRLSLIR